MADFIDQLLEVATQSRAQLLEALGKSNEPHDSPLSAFVAAHWRELPGHGTPAAGPAGPAFAIDGSLRQVDLDNGCYLIIAQALCIGADGFERSAVDVQILPATTPRSTAGRFADLVQRRRELELAGRVARQDLEEGSTLYLDGALYGLLPQLYPLSIEDMPSQDQYPNQVLADYLELLEAARERNIQIVAVSKTSRQATHASIWNDALSEAEQVELPSELSDSGLIRSYVGDEPGYSAPVLLGTQGFSGGSEELLERVEVQEAPAIASFFLRLSPFDDLLRIDVPGYQLGAMDRLGDFLKDESKRRARRLDADPEAILSLLSLLASDHGGSEVYNALLYSVDREVRLRREMVSEVYLPLISQALEIDLRADRSARRFM